MSETKQVDAVLYPAEKLPPGSEQARALWVNRTLGPVLGCARVHGRNTEGGVLFTREHADVTRFHPQGHPEEGGERYEWVETPDGSGILYGGLIDDGKPAAPRPGPDGGRSATSRKRDALAALPERTEAQERQLGLLNHLLGIPGDAGGSDAQA